MTTPDAVIQTHSGQALCTLNPDPATIRFDDIAVALSRKTRFNGHVPFYSVAQHCVLGSQLLPSPFKLAFLLHEVSEVYLPDVPGPLKPFVEVRVSETVSYTWKALEQIHTIEVLNALGLQSLEPLIHSPEVKRMDAAMLMAEANALHPEPLIEQWKAITVEPADVGVALDPELLWAPEQAELRFRAAFERYTKP